MSAVAPQDRPAASAAAEIGAALAASMLLIAALAFAAGAHVGADVGAHEAGQARLAEIRAREALNAPPARFADTGPVLDRAGLDTAQPRPRLAVIIDDIGFDEGALNTLLQMDASLTLSVLPYAPDAPDLASRIRAAGHELFLHLPMEPAGLEDPGPHALTKDLPAPAMAARARWALSRTPGARGVNNHMGSRLTSDPQAVARALAPLAGEGLVFVDSLTSPRSVAAKAAEELGFTAARRDVFLDHVRERSAIEARLDEALVLAQTRGGAIAIGHPYPETLAALASLNARASAAGVEIVFASEIAGDRTGALEPG